MGAGAGMLMCALAGVAGRGVRRGPGLLRST